MEPLAKMRAKTLLGTLAAGAMAVSTATPAMAQHYRDHDRGGIGAGEIIAGALVIGGIAAIASSAKRNNDRYDRGYGYGYDARDGNRYDRRNSRYGYGMDPRQAVQACVRTAERTASRHSYGGRADVTDIRKVDRKRGGYKIEGRIAVNAMGRNYRQGDRRYGNGWGNDHRGWNSSLRGYDSGKFKCEIRNGRIVDLDYSGIRGL